MSSLHIIIAQATSRGCILHAYNVAHECVFFELQSWKISTVNMPFITIKTILVMISITIAVAKSWPTPVRRKRFFSKGHFYGIFSEAVMWCDIIRAIKQLILSGLILGIERVSHFMVLLLKGSTSVCSWNS